jgi:hypothetical protein
MGETMKISARLAATIAAGVMLGGLGSSALATSDCESGHWIKSVQADGKIVILEDGSVWEVDDVDMVDTALWLATEEIVVCDDKLINTDDDETVDAKRLR